MDLVAAEAAADELDELQPYLPVVGELRRAIGAARDREITAGQAESRRGRVREAVAGITATLVRGDLDRAEREVAFAQARFPEEARDGELAGIARRVAEARAARQVRTANAAEEGTPGTD